MEREFVHKALRFYLDNYVGEDGQALEGDYDELCGAFDASFVHVGMRPLAVDADGFMVRLGDDMVWRNPYGEDDDERFTVRGLWSEANGDPFLIGKDFDRHYLGWCHHEGA